MEAQTITEMFMNNLIFILAVVSIAVIIGMNGVHKRRPPKKYFIYYVEEEKGTNIKLPCNDLIDIHPLEWQTKHAIYIQGKDGGYATIKEFRRTLVMWIEISEETYLQYDEPIDTLWSSY